MLLTTTTVHMILVSPILIVLLNSNRQPQYNVTNANIICNSLSFLGGIEDLQRGNHYQLSSDFSSKLQYFITSR